MAGERDGIHIETDEARGGSTPHVVRWILGIGLFLVITAFTIIVLIGASSQGDVEEEANVSNVVRDQEQQDEYRDDIDGILIEDADEIETGTSEGATRIPNETGEATSQEGRQ
jgi:preprotein translocase subunit SecF